jgi:hypothetical protein
MPGLGIDIRKADMHFIVQPPSRSLQAKITYEFTAQDAILIWDFGRGLELIFWQASFPVQSIQRDTLRQTLTFVAADCAQRRSAHPYGAIRWRAPQHGVWLL